MRLSELKQLHPLAWEAAKAESIKQGSEKKFSEYCEYNCKLSQIMHFSITLQGYEVWADIDLRCNFQAFDEWVKEQILKLCTTETENNDSTKYVIKHTGHMVALYLSDHVSTTNIDEAKRFDTVDEARAFVKDNNQYAIQTTEGKFVSWINW